MQLATFSYGTDRRWSCAELPALDSEATLLIAFGAPELRDDPAPFRALRAAFPLAHLIGCSTSGEIDGTSISDGTLVVAAARFAGARLRSVATPIASSTDSFAAGTRLAGELVGPDLRWVLVLSEGLDVNGSALVRGLSAQLDPGVVVTGGLAADGSRFERTWVLRDGLPTERHVTAVGVYGDSLRVGHGSKGGWDIFGLERAITRSSGNVLYELDGRPALDLYKEYLGERASGLPATALLFPLEVGGTGDDSRSVVRTVLSVDEAERSMTFAGDVPQGARARLMRANFDRLVQGAADAATLTRQGDVQGPVLALAISCVGRRLVLGERAEEETDATVDALPPGTRQIGFYSYGEISPLATGSCDLHNQTMTLTTISEG